MKETKIYVGLNDADMLSQRFETKKYVSILRKVCYNYHVAFSIMISEGGYFHENGDYTQENTLILSLIDTETETVEEIAKDLCLFFHQESVLITEGEVKAWFVREAL